MRICLAKEAEAELTALEGPTPNLADRVRGVISILEVEARDIPETGGFSIKKVQELFKRRVLVFRLRDDYQMWGIRVFFFRRPSCVFVTGIHSKASDPYSFDNEPMKRAIMYWATRTATNADHNHV